MNGNTKALTERQAIAAEALTALDTCHQISPFSGRLSAFDLDDAYRVTAAIRQTREMPVGRKIGFTNRTVWAEYGPIWGYVYNRTSGWSPNGLERWPVAIASWINGRRASWCAEIRVQPSGVPLTISLWSGL